MIERKILIGLITNTEFLKQIEEEWDPNYMVSKVGKAISDWCWEYYKKYRKAPMREIETIYLKKLKAKKITKETAEEIESEILPRLSDEYDQESDLTTLLDDAREFFEEQQVQMHIDELSNLLGKGRVKEAVQSVEKFKVKGTVEEESLDLSSEKALQKLEEAFDQSFEPVVRFPGALGEFWNDQLVRGALVGILAPEKRGKSFLLLEFMMRAYAQNKRVAFFQAGDMTEAQQMVRTAIYLSRKSNKEKYCGTHYLPVQDCIKNQKDTCTKRVRECSFGLFGEEVDTREDISKEDLIEAYESNPDYKPCFNCKEWLLEKNHWGAPWLTKINIKDPVTKQAAVRVWKKFFTNAGRAIKLATYVNGTLNVSKIEKQLDTWKEKEGFEPDIVLVDYGDLLVPELRGDFRHQEDDKWKKLRGLSQKTNALWVIPTQADAESYKKGLLDMSNYSEDKRKNAHVTALYGLNQDVQGREKSIGLMRFNKIVIREGEFHSSQQVYVLQNLSIGRPHLGSFF